MGKSAITVLQLANLNLFVFRKVNDVLVNNRKIAGVLCQSVALPLEHNFSSSISTAVFISIGLNVSTAPSLGVLEENERQATTCIVTELKGETTSHNSDPSTVTTLAESTTCCPSSVLTSLSSLLHQYVCRYETEGFRFVHSGLTEIGAGLGQPVLVANASVVAGGQGASQQSLQGILVGLEANSGHLLVRLNDGQIVEICNGELSLSTEAKGMCSM